MSPWNKSPNEWECSDCSCWSPIGQPCWYCKEAKKEPRNED